MTPYFHLLGSGELGSLLPILEILRDHRDAVLERWWVAYVEAFGDARSLSAAAFRQVYGCDLDNLARNLLEGDLEGFEADERALGDDLVERRVPFAEVVASLHLFEESAAEIYEPRLPEAGRLPGIYLTFDKLSHVRMILLADTFFSGHQSRGTTRIRRLEAEAASLAGGAGAHTSFHGLVGRSAAMRDVYEQIAAASAGQGAVLIVGDTGSGKELVARALHECGGETSRPFVVVNCAALPRELIESELFGHRRGAYTGALGDYEGLIRAASGGTLLLDEVTEMAVEVQAKLLRVLEEHVARPVGATQELAVNVRFVASTNRDPEKAVEARLLRKDLYYRLNVHRIAVPPLRVRREDIEPLVNHFQAALAERGMRRTIAVEPEAIAALGGYAWPGNVRELRNVVEHALTVTKDEVLRAADVPAHVRHGARPTGETASRFKESVPTLEEAERVLLLRALEATGGNKLQAARMLRISRHRLYDRLHKFGLEA